MAGRVFSYVDIMNDLGRSDRQSLPYLMNWVRMADGKHNIKLGIKRSFSLPSELIKSVKF